MSMIFWFLNRLIVAYAAYLQIFSPIGERTAGDVCPYNDTRVDICKGIKNGTASAQKRASPSPTVFQRYYIVGAGLARP